jgi:hypothetical protein
VTKRPLLGLSFELPSGVLATYAALALGWSGVLLSLCLLRGQRELALWLGAYLLVAVVAVLRPDASVLAAGTLACLLGFVRTYRHGYNLDLGLGLIALAAGLYLWRRARESERSVLDVSGLALLSIAAWSLLSLAFSLTRIWAFRPAPGFAYHVYRFNPFGLSSEEAMVRATLGAAVAFVWFGLYEYVRSVDLKRGHLAVTVFVVLVVDAAALLVQRHVDPGFLHPAGLPLIDRLNGVTSFCYALGDVALALFLLLPAWGAARGVRGALTVASVALLVHAMVASGSRTALLAALVATFAWGSVEGVRRFRSGQLRAAVLILFAVASLVGGSAAAYWITPADQATPLGRLKEGISRQGVYGHLLATRLSSYPLVFRVLGRYPLAGVGAGLYPAEIDKQRALLAPDVAILDPYLLTSNAPNQFLSTGVELGALAMAALAVVFVFAAWRVWPRGHAGSAALAVSLLVLAGGLQLGPALLNSEAVVFLWLVVGLAVKARPVAEQEGGRLPVGRAATGVVLLGALVLGLVGQLLARPGLAVESQWRQLRWRLNVGMYPQEPGGQWTSPEATFAVGGDAPSVTIRWHAGDEKAPGYRADVSFYVDGTLVERSLADGGRIRQSVLRLPAVAGFKRVSVRVSPPFVPSTALGSDDRRTLGIFIHLISPEADRSP